MEPLDFIARLVAAIPPPRFHLLRFHGVLAAHATLRPLVVPKHELAEQKIEVQLSLTPTATAPSTELERRERSYKGRHPWALLLRHVFAVDVTRCAHCRAPMRLLELCTTPAALRSCSRSAENSRFGLPTRFRCAATCAKGTAQKEALNAPQHSARSAKYALRRFLLSL